MKSDLPYIQHQVTGQVAEASRPRLAVYCHYDADGLLADYVLHAVQALAAEQAEVIFVSNGQGMTPERLQPLLPYVRLAVIRQNKGYDFGAYYTGLQLAGDWNRYRQIMITNDSVYGPFAPLADIFQTMEARNLHLWGMTDGIAHRYYVQSWFQLWENKDGLFDALQDFWRDFTFEDDKEKVITRYELGLSQHLLKKAYRLGAFCPQERALAERPLWLKEDALYRQIDAATAEHLYRRKKQGLLECYSYRLLRRNWRLYDYWQRGIAIPQYSLWYPWMAFMGLPFLKVALLKDPKLVLQHQFAYLAVLAKKYPAYDSELIQQHVHRIRAMHLPKGI